MVKIVQKENPVLRAKALPIAAKDIKSPRVRKIIRDMKTALKSQDDGVAIAAPQNGASVRIFIISGRVFSILYPEKKKTSREKDIVCINPEMMKISKEKASVEEGCLSVRYKYGQVERAKKARIKALNEKGETFELGGTGLLAQIFQHEIDHLNGVLFIDKAKNVHDLPPEIKNEIPHERKKK